MDDTTVDYYSEAFSRPDYLNYGSPPLFDTFCTMNDAKDWYLDISVIESLQAAGQISVSTGADLFGRPVSIAEKDNAVHSNPLTALDRCRVAYDSGSGFRFQIETLGGESGWSEYSVVGLQFNWTVDKAVLRPSTSVEVRREYQTREFSTSTDFEYPTDMSGIWSPTTTNFSNGYFAGPLSYIENKYHSDPWSYWAVVQQLLGPDGKEIDVVQSSEDTVMEDGPFALYWPDFTWADDIPPNTNDTVTTTLASGITVDVFELDSSTGMHVRYLITLAHSPKLRILFLGNQNVSRQELIDAANDYLDGAVIVTPTLAPVATFTDTPTATPTATATETATPTSTPTPATFSPAADAYTLSTNPTQNYGTASVLNIRGSSAPYYRTYLKFDVSGLSGTVTSAVLRLWVSDTSVDYGQLGSVSSSWTETGLTWNNQPSLPMSFLPVEGPENGYVTVNVTSEITGNGTHSFGIQSLSTDLAAFGSREDSNADRRPLLTIVTQ